MTDSVRSRSVRRAAAARPAVAPIARAIRTALAASTLALALAAQAEAPGRIRPFGTTILVHDGVTDVIDAGDAVGLGVSDDIVDVRNTGHIGAHGGTSAIGLNVSGGDLTIVNDGDLVADAVSAGGSARARGVYAVAFGGDAGVDNQGDIAAFADAAGGRAEAHGIYAFGYGGPTTVVNAGDIDSHATAVDGRAYATGINAIGYGGGANVSSVVNTGSIDALAEGDRAYAFGIFNLTRQSGGSALTDNAGDVRAEAIGDAATATGIINLALRYGDATLVNSGDVTAIADGGAYASATGLYNHAYVQDSAVDNLGDVAARADGEFALAVGIYAAAGTYGDASVANAGRVDAHAVGGGNQARAAGVVAMSEHAAAIVNDGDVAAVADTQQGFSTAVGLYAVGAEFASIHNYADVAAVATADDGAAYAYGALVFSGQTGIGLLVNGGDLHAEAVAGGGDAVAIAAYVSAEVASVFNDGSATALANAVGGDALARGARVYSMYGAIENNGTIVAAAGADGGDAGAIGADAFGYFGSTVTNNGDLGAYALAAGGDASASGIYSIGVVASSYVYNTGSVRAEARSDGAAVANGIVSASLAYGHGVTVNSGDVTAIAVGGLADYGVIDALAFGIYNSALAYSSVVENTGNVTAVAHALADIAPADGMVQAQALGITAINTYGIFDTAVYNAGTIAASARASTGFATAWGVAAQSSGLYGGGTVVANDGTISAYAHADIGVAEANGVYAANYFGDVGIVNYGDVVAVAATQRGVVNQVVNYAYATGVAVATVYGATTIENHGDITAVARSYGAINQATGVAAQGATATVHNAAGATIRAVADAERFGLGRAIGAMVSGTYYAGFVNDGTVIAYGHANAFLEREDQGFYGAASVTGIGAIANLQGDVVVVNNGDVFATAIADDVWTGQQGGAGATGVNTYAKYDALVENNGRIHAFADSSVGIASAYGAVGEGKYSTEIVNHGDIVAVAIVGSLAGDPYGGRSVAMGAKVFHSDHASIVNDGLIVAHATATADGTVNALSPTMAQSWGASIGYNSTVLDGVIDNAGGIESVANAELGQATAYGAFVSTVYDSAIVNSGDIVASATARGGDAWAVGAFGYALYAEYVVPCDADGCHYDQAYFLPKDGVVRLDNSGTIVALADAEGGVATAYGAAQVGAFGSGIVNGGDILAIATADDASARGALANSFYGVAAIANDGLIAGNAEGAVADAIGAQAIGGSAGTSLGMPAATIVNAGDIVARADGAVASATGAIATDRGLDGAAIDNAGRIAAGAYGADAIATAVVLASYGVNTLVNSGVIAALGDGERIAVRSSDAAIADLSNGGTLIGAIRTGGLADTFANAADATWLAVGASTFGAGDDTVGNAGLVWLDDATIDLGGQAGDAFANSGLLVARGDGNAIGLGAGAFGNDGRIDFVDGAADDALAIAGHFAGTGTIGFDVDGLAGGADRLSIAGDVAAGSVQTLDVNLLTRPEAAEFAIALVNVGGDATAGNFVLGDVGWQSSLVTLDFDLIADIDASNATDDVFALGVRVTGLTAAGKVAAATAPGVQSLVDAQVGTWRQRMGVRPDGGDAPVAWVRAFSASGDVAAGHAGFGAGDVGFQQSAQGWELGLDFALGERFTVGMLASRATANQDLAADPGRTRFDAETFGLYATWRRDGGFYVDLSQRWTGVDARLRLPGGPLDTEVTATTTNLEAGYTGWRVGAVGITPQLQLTHTRIGDVTPLLVGGSVYADAGGHSTRARAGVLFERSFEAGGFALTPYGSLGAVHEFDGEYAHAINGGIAGTTSLQGTSALVELGLGLRRDGLSIGAGVNWIDGGAQDGFIGGQVSVRYAW